MRRPCRSHHPPRTPGRRAPARTAARPWAATGLAAALLVVVLSACAATPAPAQAIIPPDPFSILGGAVSAQIGNLAVGAFDAIIKHLFAPITKFITVELIGWLAAVPDFTHVAQLQTTVCAMGGGLLAAVATISSPATGRPARGRRRLRFSAPSRASRARSEPRCCWRCGRGCSQPRSTWPTSRARTTRLATVTDDSARLRPPDWEPRAR